MTATIETLGIVGESTPEELASAALTLARRCAEGATMWCVAPQWPAHGDHVAVEFVHPVIVGKRALPAVHLAGRDCLASLRLLARPGDVLVAISTSDHPLTLDLLQRAEAWGLTRLWLGAGRRPPSDCAEHMVWIEGVDPEPAARCGDIVLLYHLLWELTHVVFEHPGLLVDEPTCVEDVCISCSDEGRVGEVQGITEDGRADVVVNGVREAIDVTLVDPVHVGDLLLIHAGVALTTLETIALLSPETVQA